ncbi:isochorismatase domain-containing protein 1-like [Saccoglossus kowalevskii]|uniref:Isochorismatase domain-containing protein 1 n=1 Tax=Saccoglossus kowalevskii TaxID=10224 RepID=A0ABM0GR12_SACKO|nr:PREDICTED: isochorismatase domain-containing protein 1-like [Saccoglossus kowalevskii]
MAAHTVLGNLSIENTAIFLCDMQEKFRPHIKYFNDILTVSQRVVQASKILGIPLIVTEQYPKGLGSTVSELDVSHAKGIYPKTKFSMVVPEVENAMKEIPNLKSVVLLGIEAHVCIQQTTLDLLTEGVEVHIVADATSSRSQMDRTFAFSRLRQAGAIITTSEAVLLQLVADKDHDKFKEIQGLIKISAPMSGLESSL